MFGGRPGFRWWRRPSRVFIHTTDTHRCACKFRTLGNAREADDGKRGTRVAIMLAWKSWKRGPEGQPLLPTFRVQTIAICLLAAGVMQRAPTAIRCHRAASESYKQTACLRFSFPLPSSSLFLSFSLSHSFHPLLFSKRTGLERGDVLRKQGQLSSPRIYERLRNFSARWNSRPGWKRVQRAEEL